MTTPPAAETGDDRELPPGSGTSYPLVPAHSLPRPSTSELKRESGGEPDAPEIAIGGGEQQALPPPPGDGGERPALPGPDPERPPKKRRHRVLKLLGVLLLFALGLFLVRDAWLGPLVAHLGGQLLSAQLERQVEITAVSGSYVTNLTAHGVRIAPHTGDRPEHEPVPPDPLRRAYFGAVTVRYDLLALLRGSPTWVREVHLQEASATLDLRYLDLRYVEEDPEAQVMLPEALPVGELPRLRVDEARLTLVAEEGAWIRLDDIRGVGAHVAPPERAAQTPPAGDDVPEPTYRLWLIAGQVSGELAAERFPMRDAAAELVLREREIILASLRTGPEWIVGPPEPPLASLNGAPPAGFHPYGSPTRGTPGNGAGPTEVQGPEMLTELARDTGLRVQLLPVEQALKVDGELALFGGSLTVRDTLLDLAAAGAVVQADVRWEGLRAERMLGWLDDAPVLPVSAAGTLDGFVRGRLDTGEPERSDAEVRATLSQARFAGVAIPQASVRARLHEQRGPEAELTVQATGFELHANMQSETSEPLLAWLRAHGVLDEQIHATAASDSAEAPPQKTDAPAWPPLTGSARLEVADAARLRAWLRSSEVLGVLGPGLSEQLLALHWPRMRNAHLKLETELTVLQEPQRPELLLLGTFAGPDDMHVEVGPLVLTGEPENWLESEFAGDILVVLPRMAAARGWHPALAELEVGGAARATLVGAGTLQEPEVELTLTGERLELAGIPPLGASLEARWESPGRLVVPELHIRSVTGDRVRGVCVFDAAARPPRLEQLYLDVRIVHLGEYAGLLGLRREEVQGRLLLRTTGALSTASVTEQAGPEVGEVSEEVVGAEVPLVLPPVQMHLEASRLRVAALEVPAARLRLTAQDTRLALEQGYLRTTQGTLQVRAGLDWADAHAVQLELEQLRYAWRGLHLELEQRTTLRLDPRGPAGRWHAEEVEDAAENGGPSSLGTALPVLEFVEPLRLTGDFGTLRVAGAWPRDEPGELRVRGELTELGLLAPLLPPTTPRPVARRVVLDARLTRELAAITASVDDLRPVPELPPLQVSLQAEYGERRLELDELRVSWSSPRRLEAPPSTFQLEASLPLDPFAATAPARLPGAERTRAGAGEAPPLTVRARLAVADLSWARPFVPAPFVPRGSLLATVDAAGTWSQPEVHLLASTGEWHFEELTTEALEALNDAVEITPAQAAKVPRWQRLNARLDVRYLEEVLHIRHSYVHLPEVEVRFGLDGMVAQPLSVRDLLLGQPLEPIGEGELRLSGRIPELEDIPVPTREVRAVAGSLDWSLTVDAGILGEPWEEPHFGGEARLRNANLIVAGLPPITALGLHLEFDERRIVLADGRALMGAAPLIFTPGSFVGLPDADDAVELDLTVDGANVLLIREEAIRVRTDLAVTLRGALPLTEEAEALIELDEQRELAALGGEVVIRESRFVEVIDLLGIRGPGGGGGGSVVAPDLVLFSLDAPPFSRVRLEELRVRTHPGEAIALESNLFSGDVRVGLVLTGTLALPRPLGTATLVDGRLRLPTTTLTVESALATFEEGAPFDPMINAFGRTRMLGYDISVSLNSPFSRLGEVDLNFASDPPLPPGEVALLVLTGKPPEAALTADTATAAAQRLAIYFGRDILGLLFGADPTLDPGFDEFLDRIEIETGRQVSRTGVETIEVRFRLWDDLVTDNDRVYIEGERDFYDEFNAGLTIRFRLR